MDATSNVVADELPCPVVPDGNEKTAAALRDEVERTSAVLHEHVDELRERMQTRVESLRNPFGVHDFIESKPLAACGIALFAGALLGLMKGRPGFGATTKQIGASVGSTLAQQATSRILNRVVGGFLPRW